MHGFPSDKHIERLKYLDISWIYFSTLLTENSLKDGINTDGEK